MEETKCAICKEPAGFDPSTGEISCEICGTYTQADHQMRILAGEKRTFEEVLKAMGQKGKRWSDEVAEDRARERSEIVQKMLWTWFGDLPGKWDSEGKFWPDGFQYFHFTTSKDEGHNELKAVYTCPDCHRQEVVHARVRLGYLDEDTRNFFAHTILTVLDHHRCPKKSLYQDERETLAALEVGVEHKHDMTDEILLSIARSLNRIAGEMESHG